MEEISEKEPAKERTLGLGSSQDSATVIDGLKEDIYRVIRDKIEIEMLENARVAKTVNLELEVRQLTESLKISRNEEALMRAKVLELEESVGLAVEKEEERARKNNALVGEKKDMEKSIEALTEQRDSLYSVLENKQRELDEANKTRDELEQVKVSQGYEIAGLLGEVSRVRDVMDEMKGSRRELAEKNEQLVSQVQKYRDTVDGVMLEKDNMRKGFEEEKAKVENLELQVAEMKWKLEQDEAKLGRKRREKEKLNKRNKELVMNLELLRKEKEALQNTLLKAQGENDDMRNKRSSPTEETSLRKKGKIEQSPVQGYVVLESDAAGLRMYADIENIAQMLTVCEVHMAAEKRLSGSAVMDWYGVLQTERLADEAAIKKQYRRLALLLHPDKNKFPGAEGAFKFIGEAYRVLSDPAKKASHDMKFGSFVNLAARKAKTSSHHSNGNVTAANHKKKAENNQKNSYPQPTFWNPQQLPQTFWTVCKNCNSKFQYYLNVANATLLCTNCLKSFIAHPVRFGQGVQPAASFNIQKEAPMQCPPKPASESKGGKPCATGVSQQFNGEKNKGMESQIRANAGSKRVWQSAPDYRGSFNTENGDGKKDANVRENDVDPSRSNVRRSSRKKQDVSYVESPVADKFCSPSKKPRQSGSFNTNEAEKENMPTSNNDEADYAAGVVDQNIDVRNKTSGPTEETPLRSKKKSEQSQEEKVLESDLDARRSKEDNCSPLNSNVPSDPEIIPDTEFNDFDKDKAEDCFAVNQFWAIYDSSNSMPRFYALVRKVATPFMLKISWLEPDPDDEGEIDWHDADLPIACGKFKLGGSENVTDRTMFSHQIQCMKRSGKGSYMVYPKKGETWAIFRDWNIKWSSNPENHLKHEFECVEILSDFSENVGIEVAYLVKVKGFVSLFQKTEKNGVNISCVVPNELYRFSHRIPSYKMTGNEREGVPRGCFELDTAALPTKVFDVGDSGDAGSDSQSWKQHQRDSTSMSTGQQTLGTVAAC